MVQVTTRAIHVTHVERLLLATSKTATVTVVLRVLVSVVMIVLPLLAVTIALLRGSAMIGHPWTADVTR